MDIPTDILPLMKCVIVVKHVKSPLFVSGERRSSNRKFVNIAEVTRSGGTVEVSKWNPGTDTFDDKYAESYLLKQMALGLDLSVDFLLEELERRKEILLWMANMNIRDYRSVNEVLNTYYNDPAAMYLKVSQDA
jgi:hypothetical protein